MDSNPSMLPSVIEAATHWMAEKTNSLRSHSVTLGRFFGNLLWYCCLLISSHIVHRFVCYLEDHCGIREWMPAFSEHSFSVLYAVMNIVICTFLGFIPTILCSRYGANHRFFGIFSFPPHHNCIIMTSVINSTLSLSVERLNGIIASGILSQQMIAYESTTKALSTRDDLPEDIKALILIDLYSSKIHDLSSEKRAIKMLTGNGALSSEAMALIISFAFDRERYVVPSIDGQRMITNVESSVSIQMENEQQQRLMRKIHVVRLQ